jgi:hypothetical protein
MQKCLKSIFDIWIFIRNWKLDIRNFYKKQSKKFPIFYIIFFLTYYRFSYSIISDILTTT